MNASAQTYSIVHNFASGSPVSDGQNPSVSLITGLDGNYYGMTTNGGTASQGTIFKMTPQGVVTIIHSFEDATVANDGFNPSSLMQTSDGTLWGTTSQGGTSYPSTGAIFKISPQGVYSIVYAFQDGNDGAGPNGLVQGTDGNFYGTSYSGGYNNGGGGVFWMMTPQGVLTPTYTFQENNITDGSGPGGSLVEGTDGNFYGTTISGSGIALAGGTIYKMTPAGVRTIIQGYAISTGIPVGGLKEASDGNMYGMTMSGGLYSDGTIYKVASQSTVSVIYNFGTNSTLDGADPVGNVILGSDGNLYGATSETYTNGGKGGTGLVFQVTTQGQMSVIHQFTVGTLHDGNQPTTGLVQGPDGNLYGTTYYGNQLNCGIVYEEAITASAPPPVITGLLSRSATVGTAFPKYQIIASNSPQSYAATGLPHGLSIDTTLGVITGTPTESGIYPVTISATNNPGGTTTKTLTITVTGPPTIANGPPPAYTVGTPYSFTYQIEAYPAATVTLTSGSFPPGLTLSSAGVLSGTPTQSGAYPATVIANNGINPKATQSFTLTVGQAPSITSPAGATFAVGQAGSFTVTATGDPAPNSFTATGLPSWASLDSTTGVLSGTPPNTITTSTTFTINLTVGNGNLPNATQVFTLKVQPPQTFSQWEASDNFTGNATVIGPTATPENDGISNLLKYFYDINPTAPMTAADRAALPTAGTDTTTTPGTQYLTLTYRQYALKTGITMNVQASTDLQTWTTLTLTQNPTPAATTYTLQQVNTDPVTSNPIMQVEVLPAGTQEFIRLNVTQ